MKFYIKMANQSILMNSRKFVHNVIGIAIGIMLLILVDSLSSSFKTELYSQMKISDDKVVTIATGNRDNTLSYMLLPVFNDKNITMLKDISNINKYVGVMGTNVTSIYYKNIDGDSKRIVSSLVYSSNEVFLELYRASLREGIFCYGENEVVIGSAVSSTYSVKIGDYIDIEHLGTIYKCKITGIINELGNMGYSSTPDMINNIILLSENNTILKNNNYISILAEVKDVNMLSDTSDEITNLFNKKDNMTQELKDVDLDAIVVNNLAILDMINVWFDYVNIFIIILFIVISLIVILNFSNLMTITVLSRNREIGIMKMIGGSNSQISTFYSIECLLTGVIGSLIGVVIGLAIVFLITYFLEWNIKISFLSIVFSIAVGTFSPTIAGILTQRKIKRQSIAGIFNS
ncbi:MAG: FtsX-like permease family protein [Clostridiales bacterium]|jgi:ABC-type antimicrobial peptide transport system permease subunit|nr:FtsX-like permease family protein [Clostridiales bacterium]